MRSARHHVHSLNVDIFVLTLHPAYAVAHTKLAKQFLDCLETVLVCAQLKWLRQSLQILALDKADQAFDLGHLQDLAMD